MGAIADRTRSRWGRFRPYLLFGALPLAFTGVLTWTVPDLDGGGRLLWAYATFTLMMLAYTVLSMPYSALSGVMTADSQQRTTLISFRFIAAFAGTTLVSWLTLDLVRWLGRGDEPLGWQLTLGLYGIIAAACFAAVFLSTRERIEPPAQQRSTMRQDVLDLLHNRPWLVLFVLALVIMVTIVMRSGSLVYYLKYYVDRPELTGLFLGSYSVALAVGAALTPLLTRLVDKRRLMMGLMAGVGVLSCAMYFVPREQIWVMFALNTAGRAAARAEVAAGVLDVCRLRRLHRMEDRAPRHRDDLRRRGVLAEARRRGGLGGDRLDAGGDGLCRQPGPVRRLAAGHRAAADRDPGRGGAAGGLGDALLSARRSRRWRGSRPNCRRGARRRHERSCLRNRNLLASRNRAGASSWPVPPRCRRPPPSCGTGGCCCS